MKEAEMDGGFLAGFKELHDRTRVFRADGGASASDYFYQTENSHSNADMKTLRVSGGQWESVEFQKTCGGGFELRWNGNFEEKELLSFLSNVSDALK